jgi:hypothetical protein
MRRIAELTGQAEQTVEQKPNAHHCVHCLPLPVAPIPTDVPWSIVHSYSLYHVVECSYSHKGRCAVSNPDKVRLFQVASAALPGCFSVDN